jgi:nitrogen-specific signal transduction histidine kinase
MPTPPNTLDPLGRTLSADTPPATPPKPASSPSAPHAPRGEPGEGAAAVLPALRLYKGPLIAAAALLGLLIAWTASEWSQAERSQLERLRRFGEMFALFADVNLHQGPKALTEDPAYAQAVLSALISQAPNVQAADLDAAGVVLARAGERAGGDTMTVTYPLRVSAAEPLTIPPSVLSWGSGGPPPQPAPAAAPGTPTLTLILNVRSVFTTNRGQAMVWKVLISLVGIASLAAAWGFSIRSRRVASELALERSRFKHLEEMNVAAAGLAHELKNPLGIVLGIAQRLRATPGADPELRRQLNQVIDAADRAAERLGEFMNFARINTPALGEVEASALVGEVAEVLRYDFEDAGVALKVECAPTALWCDGEMLKQVLVNLLLNSLHASSIGGEVAVRLRLRGRRAALEVADRGCGITAAMRAEVFKPYVTGRADGHGLGLAIVARIAECHGWRVSLESQEGQGTTIRIEDIRLHGGLPSVAPDTHAAQLGAQGASA